MMNYRFKTNKVNSYQVMTENIPFAFHYVLGISSVTKVSELSNIVHQSLVSPAPHRAGQWRGF